ncbi:MAG: tRNA (adenosine(37)-N6)-threonylcarbamoyltransferase complex ATPase subunit type 1 TsaE [Clostridiales bacterium]|nr:tRNA (adenosine(37)-N6)-threonylcarbamoyltransferase complex ATPase subunit type 1 TsaE [Clostridiales bacterium]
MKTVYETHSGEETEKIGFEFGKNAKAGEIYCINGDLGAGKTCFTKGFARGLGITDHITSPTFTIVNEYEGRLSLYHFDVYRLQDEDELYDIGADEYFFGDGVCIIEWAGIVKDAIPKGAVWIKILKDLEKDDNYRRIEEER